MKPNWTFDRPTEPGEYWLSIAPEKRRESWWPNAIEADVYRVGTGTQWRVGFRNRPFQRLTDELFNGAQWAKRETPADPFLPTENHAATTAADLEALKAEHAKELAELTEHYAEQLRQRGLSSAVTAETFNECHEALRATEQARDRERARADKAEAALAAAREKVKALPGLVTAGGWHIIGGVEKDLVLAALGIEVSPQVNAGKELAPG